MAGVPPEGFDTLAKLVRIWLGRRKEAACSSAIQADSVCVRRGIRVASVCPITMGSRICLWANERLVEECRSHLHNPRLIVRFKALGTLALGPPFGMHPITTGTARPIPLASVNNREERVSNSQIVRLERDYARVLAHLRYWTKAARAESKSPRPSIGAKIYPSVRFSTASSTTHHDQLRFSREEVRIRAHERQSEWHPEQRLNCLHPAPGPGWDDGFLSPSPWDRSQLKRWPRPTNTHTHTQQQQQILQLPYFCALPMCADYIAAGRALPRDDPQAVDLVVPSNLELGSPRALTPISGWWMKPSFRNATDAVMKASAEDE